MKKIIALALALIMVLGLATIASAATAVNGPFTVTVKNATGHEYVIYQIFTGSLATTKNEKNEDVEILSDLKYGTDYTPDGVEVGDAAVVPENPTTIVPTGDGTPMTTSGDTATATVTTAGYYMIKDVTENLPDQDTPSAVMFQVVGDTEITSKHTGTTIEKKVQDINDSTGAQTMDGNSVWIDSADHDIGDTVPFMATAKFEGLDNYETYKVVFTDTMSKGLTYVSEEGKSMKVYVNGEDKTDAFTIAVNNCADTTGEYVGGTVITVTCNDITALTDENAAEIVLEYSAVLNEEAKFGTPGNPNKIKVTNTPDGSGETVEDVNIVFTFKTDVKKVHQTGTDAEGKPVYAELTGAEFKLEKFEASENGTTTFKGVKGDWVTKELVKNDAGTIFSFEGLDDGEYRITETEAPAGYNKIDAIYFTVTATHDVETADPKLNTLEATATKPDGSAYTDEEIATGKVATFTVDKTEGQVATEVVNEAGVELPETGGMGTTLFYIIGGLLVAGAAILLITKKRMSANY